MAHPCSDQWRMAPYSSVNRVLRLNDLVTKEDLRQSSAGFEVGGWAYWLAPEAFLVFRAAYLELCRALNAPTVEPGELSPPPPMPAGMLPISADTSAKLAAWSERVIEILGADENDLQSPTLFFHPGHGMHGWLGTGVISPEGIADAERLLVSMRNALDR